MTRRAHALACLLVVRPILGAEAASFGDCERAARLSPKSVETWRCFESVGQTQKALPEAEKRLERHLALRPDEPGIRLALGRMEATRGVPRAEGLVRGAVDGYVSRRDAFGEIEARISLATFLVYRGRWPEAEAELARLKAIVEESRDATRRGQAGIMEAFLARGKGDYGRAWTALESVEGDLFPTGPANLRSLWLDHRAYIAWATGRPGEALAAYRALGDVLRELGDRAREANQRADTLVLMAEVNAPASERRVAASEAREAAQASGNRSAEARAIVYLAEASEPAEAASLSEEAVRIARTAGDPEVVGLALRAAAFHTLRLDEEQAFRYVDEARALASARGNLNDVARAEIVRSRLRWTVGPREEALHASQAALAAAEATRDLQPDSLTRARRFALWSRPYYELASHVLAGDLLPTRPAPSEEEMELAFATTERMRSRVLLDELDAARASAVLFAAGPLGKKRDDVLQEIARIQRRLFKADLPESNRADLLRLLTRAELDEGTLRGEMERADPAFAAVRRPSFPTLRQVRDSLGEDEALVDFVLGEFSTEGPNWGAGSWVLVVTRGGVRAHRLAGTPASERGVSLIRGLIESRGGAEQAGAVRLYGDFLKAALDGLPQGIRRIAVVPDRALHTLPFALLRESPTAPAVGERFEVESVPSATVWSRERRERPAPAPSRVLAFADPTLPAAAPDARASSERAWAFSAASSLASLRGARTEGRRAVERLGGRGRLLVGAEASEAEVKAARLSDYGVIHFAAHALLDDAHPERTAILLAPGNDKEDGLLQLREIVNLKLGGRIVVLSGCRSASGVVLGGEGAMSLARAFFQAGASAVIGSLWPLRDDDAAAFFDRFYAHLAKGRTVSGAVAEAQRDRIRAGAPAAAWAGIVTLGDGSSVPFPRGGSHWPMLLGLGIGGALALALALWLGWFRRKS